MSDEPGEQKENNEHSRQEKRSIDENKDEKENRNVPTVQYLHKMSDEPGEQQENNEHSRQEKRSIDENKDEKENRNDISNLTPNKKLRTKQDDRQECDRLNKRHDMLKEKSEANNPPNETEPSTTYPLTSSNLAFFNNLQQQSTDLLYDQITMETAQTLLQLKLSIPETSSLHQPYVTNILWPESVVKQETNTNNHQTQIDVNQQSATFGSSVLSQLKHETITKTPQPSQEKINQPSTSKSVFCSQSPVKEETITNTPQTSEENINLPSTSESGFWSQTPEKQETITNTPQTSEENINQPSTSESRFWSQTPEKQETITNTPQTSEENINLPSTSESGFWSQTPEKQETNTNTPQTSEENINQPSTSESVFCSQTPEKQETITNIPQTSEENINQLSTSESVFCSQTPEKQETITKTPQTSQKNISQLSTSESVICSQPPVKEETVTNTPQTSEENINQPSTSQYVFWSQAPEKQETNTNTPQTSEENINQPSTSESVFCSQTPEKQETITKTPQTSQKNISQLSTSESVICSQPPVKEETVTNTSQTSEENINQPSTSQYVFWSQAPEKQETNTNTPQTSEENINQPSMSESVFCSQTPEKQEIITNTPQTSEENINQPSTSESVFCSQTPEKQETITNTPQTSEENIHQPSVFCSQTPEIQETITNIPQISEENINQPSTSESVFCSQTPEKQETITKTSQTIEDTQHPCSIKSSFCPQASVKEETIIDSSQTSIEEVSQYHFTINSSFGHSVNTSQTAEAVSQHPTIISLSVWPTSPRLEETVVDNNQIAEDVSQHPTVSSSFWAPSPRIEETIVDNSQTGEDVSQHSSTTRSSFWPQSLVKEEKKSAENSNSQQSTSGLSFLSQPPVKEKPIVNIHQISTGNDNLQQSSTFSPSCSQTSVEQEIIINNRESLAEIINSQSSTSGSSILSEPPVKQETIVDIHKKSAESDNLQHSSSQSPSCSQKSVKQAIIIDNCETFTGNINPQPSTSRSSLCFQSLVKQKAIANTESQDLSQHPKTTGPFQSPMTEKTIVNTAQTSVEDVSQQLSSIISYVWPRSSGDDEPNMDNNQTTKDVSQHLFNNKSSFCPPVDEEAISNTNQILLKDSKGPLTIRSSFWPQSPAKENEIPNTRQSPLESIIQQHSIFGESFTSIIEQDNRQQSDIPQEQSVTLSPKPSKRSTNTPHPHQQMDIGNQLPLPSTSLIKQDTLKQPEIPQEQSAIQSSIPPKRSTNMPFPHQRMDMDNQQPFPSRSQITSIDCQHTNNYPQRPSTSKEVCRSVPQNKTSEEPSTLNQYSNVPTSPNTREQTQIRNIDTACTLIMLSNSPLQGRPSYLFPARRTLLSASEMEEAKRNKVTRLDILSQTSTGSNLQKLNELAYKLIPHSRSSELPKSGGTIASSTHSTLYNLNDSISGAQFHTSMRRKSPQPINKHTLHSHFAPYKARVQLKETTPSSNPCTGAITNSTNTPISNNEPNTIAETLSKLPPPNQTAQTVNKLGGRKVVQHSNIASNPCTGTTIMSESTSKIQRAQSVPHLEEVPNIQHSNFVRHPHSTRLQLNKFDNQQSNFARGPQSCALPSIQPTTMPHLENSEVMRNSNIASDLNTVAVNLNKLPPPYQTAQKISKLGGRKIVQHLNIPSNSCTDTTIISESSPTNQSAQSVPHLEAIPNMQYSNFTMCPHPTRLKLNKFANQQSNFARVPHPSDLPFTQPTSVLHLESNQVMHNSNIASDLNTVAINLSKPPPPYQTAQTVSKLRCRKVTQHSNIGSNPCTATTIMSESLLTYQRAQSVPHLEQFANKQSNFTRGPHPSTLPFIQPTQETSMGQSVPHLGTCEVMQNSNNANDPNTVAVTLSKPPPPYPRTQTLSNLEGHQVVQHTNIASNPCTAAKTIGDSTPINQRAQSVPHFERTSITQHSNFAKYAHPARLQMNQFANDQSSDLHLNALPFIQPTQRSEIGSHLENCKVMQNTKIANDPNTVAVPLAKPPPPYQKGQTISHLEGRQVVQHSYIASNPCTVATTMSDPTPAYQIAQSVPRLAEAPIMQLSNFARCPYPDRLQINQFANQQSHFIRGSHSNRPSRRQTVSHLENCKVMQNSKVASDTNTIAVTLNTLPTPYQSAQTESNLENHQIHLEKAPIIQHSNFVRNPYTDRTQMNKFAKQQSNYATDPQPSALSCIKPTERPQIAQTVCHNKWNQIIDNYNFAGNSNSTETDTHLEGGQISQQLNFARPTNDFIQITQITQSGLHSGDDQFIQQSNFTNCPYLQTLTLNESASHTGDDQINHQLNFANGSLEAKLTNNESLRSGQNMQHLARCPHPAAPTFNNTLPTTEIEQTHSRHVQVSDVTTGENLAALTINELTTPTTQEPQISQARTQTPRSRSQPVMRTPPYYSPRWKPTLPRMIRESRGFPFFTRCPPATTMVTLSQNPLLTMETQSRILVPQVMSSPRDFAPTSPISTQMHPSTSFSSCMYPPTTIFQTPQNFPSSAEEHLNDLVPYLSNRSSTPSTTKIWTPQTQLSITGAEMNAPVPYFFPRLLSPVSTMIQMSQNQRSVTEALPRTPMPHFSQSSISPINQPTVTETLPSTSTPICMPRQRHMPQAQNFTMPNMPPLIPIPPGWVSPRRSFRYPRSQNRYSAPPQAHIAEMAHTTTASFSEFGPQRRRLYNSNTFLPNRPFTPRTAFYSPQRRYSPQRVQRRHSIYEPIVVIHEDPENLNVNGEVDNNFNPNF